MKYLVFSFLLIGCAPPLQQITMPDGDTYKARIEMGTLVTVTNGDKNITWDAKKPAGPVDQAVTLATLAVTNGITK